MSQFNGGTDLLGNRTSVTITIRKNDDANGVFSFAQDSLQIAIGIYNVLYIRMQCVTMLVKLYVDEIPPGFSGDLTPYRAVFTVQRARGTFGDVIVNWTVVNPTSDISPIEGILSFRENDAMATFTIFSTADNVWRSSIHRECTLF